MKSRLTLFALVLLWLVCAAFILKAEHEAYYQHHVRTELRDTR